MVEQLSTIGIAELFPSMGTGGQPSSLQVDMLRMSQDLGVPFPAEPNPRYANWWRSLHEIAHWAIKPEWYNHQEFGAQNIPMFRGVPDEEVRALDPQLPEQITAYKAGNDIIPNMGMLDETDPTPSEPEVRAWSIAIMARRGLMHPFVQVLRDKMPPREMEALGDDGWHKIATAQVWAPTSLLNPRAISRMAQFGVNPLMRAYRPMPTDFMPPHCTVESAAQLHENFASIIGEYAITLASAEPVIPEAGLLGERYWNVYSTWKRFFVDETPGAEYERLLDEFNAVQLESLQVFSRVWPEQAARHGHEVLAMQAAEFALTGIKPEAMK